MADPGLEETMGDRAARQSLPLAAVMVHPRPRAMTFRRQLLIVIPLSLAAAWAGSHFASLRSSVPAAPSLAPVRAGNSGGALPPSHHADKTRSRQTRELIASTATATLWEWLFGNAAQGDQGVVRNQVLRELYARKGLEAWTGLLAHEDPAIRESLSREMLGMISVQDPWLAYELFLANKGSFNAEWGKEAGTSILTAACHISADKFVEVMERSGFKDTHYWFNVELPPGFDYARLIHHLETSEHMPAGLPSDLVSKWAAESPLKAVEWLLSKPTPKDGDPLSYVLEEEMVFHNTLLEIAGSKAAGRDESLAEFSKLPPSTLDKTWTRLVEKLDGKINPAVLEASTKMERREDYLIRSLLETRGNPSPDPSWSAIPPEEKSKLLDLAEARWQADAPAPVDDKARRHWRARLEQAWSLK